VIFTTLLSIVGSIVMHGYAYILRECVLGEDGPDMLNLTYCAVSQSVVQSPLRLQGSVDIHNADPLHYHKACTVEVHYTF